MCLHMCKIYVHTHGANCNKTCTQPQSRVTKRESDNSPIDIKLQITTVSWVLGRSIDAADASETLIHRVNSLYRVHDALPLNHNAS